MQVAYVLGYATATIKHSSFNGRKLLAVQPLKSDGSPDGDPLIVVDGTGAGRGERVMISSDGPSTRKLLNVDSTPCRWSVIGVVDE